MPKLTQEQFAQIVKAAADARRKVKILSVGDHSVVADIASRSGKMAYQWVFEFDKVTGDYKYWGTFPTANEPKFFGDAIRSAIKGITGE